MTAGTRGPLEDMDAVVIGGGDDISPALYGDLANPDAQYDPDRDQFESEVIDYALLNRIPILGICRGAQLLNVKLGGTLYGDIRNMRRHTSNRNTLFPRKRVRVEPDSGLHAALGAATISVNSLHFQAVKDVGAGLQIVARDRDNIVQAIEDPDRRLLGVQWHPEYIPQSRVHRRIFRDLFLKAGTGRDSSY
jgi:putative glutamine amidotransferase